MRRKKPDLAFAGGPGRGFTALALTTLLPGTGFDVHIAKMAD
jgi:hypothetical protein